MGVAEHNGVRSNFSKSSGKWYFEVTIDSGTTHYVGIGTEHANLNDSVGSDEYGYAYCDLDGKKYHNATPEAFGNTFEAGDVVGVALDLDNNKVWFSKNGVWQDSGVPASGTDEAYSIAPGTYFAMWSGYDEGQATANFGDSAFSHSLPSGFTAFATGWAECIWDEDHAGADVSVLGDLLSASVDYPGSFGQLFEAGSSIGILGRASGQFYFEVLVECFSSVQGTGGGAYASSSSVPNLDISADLQVGVASVSLDTGLSIVGADHAEGVRSSVEFGTSVSGGGLVIYERYAYQVIGVGVDFDNDLMWYTYDGTNWSSRELPAELIGVTLYPAGTAAALSKNSYSGDLLQAVNSQLTLLANSSQFTYTLLSDFRAWADFAETESVTLSEDVQLSDTITVNVEMGGVPATYEATLEESFTSDDDMWGNLPGETEDPDSGHIGESFTVDDAITVDDPYRDLSEDVELSDAIEVESPYRNLSENVELSDEITCHMEEWQADISENVELSGSIVSPIYAENEEDVELSDSWSAYKEWTADPIRDTVFLDDDISATKHKENTLTEYPQFIDVAGFTWLESVSSTMDATDAVTIEVATAANDRFGIQDTVTIQWSGTETISDVFGLEDVGAFSWLETIEDEFDIAETALCETAWGIEEYFIIRDTVSNLWTGTITVSDSLRIFGESIIVQIYNETATSTADITDTATYLHRLISVIADGLDITDAVTPAMTYNPVIAEAVAIAGALSVVRTLNLASSETFDAADSVLWQWSESVTEEFDISDAATLAWYAILALTSNLEFTDTVLSTLHVDETVADVLDFATTLAIQQMLSLSIDDGFNMAVLVELDGELWETWVLNTNAFHASVYSGFSFNSYAVYNDTAYACKSDGIYKLTGSTDDGVAITAGIVLPETYFGTSRKKKFRKAYFGLSGGTTPSLRVETDSGSTTYTIASSKANVGRNMYGRTWTLKVQDFEGLDFIELVPVILSR